MDITIIPSLEFQCLEGFLVFGKSSINVSYYYNYYSLFEEKNINLNFDKYHEGWV